MMSRNLTDLLRLLLLTIMTAIIIDDLTVRDPWTTLPMMHGTISGPIRRFGPTQPGTITSMNVNGFMTETSKQLAAADLITGSNAQPGADIVALQEIKAAYNRDEPLGTTDSQTLATNVNPGGRSWWTPYCGVCISPCADPAEATAATALNGRVVELRYLGLRLVDIYAPSDPDERREFYVTLAALITPGEDLICVGDWNLAPDPSCQYDWLNGNVSRRDVGGAELRGMLASLRTPHSPAGLLELTTALALQRSPRDYTYISPPREGQRRYRRLDWFATSTTILARVEIKSVRTSTFWLKSGDHAAVTIRLRSPGARPKSTKARLHLNPTLAAQGTFHDEMAVLVQQTTAECKDAPDAEVLRATDKLFSDIGTLYTAHAAALRAQRHAVTQDALEQLDTLLDQHPDPRTWNDTFHAAHRSATARVADLVEKENRESRETVEIDFTCCSSADSELYKTVVTHRPPVTFTSQAVYVPDLADEHTIDRVADVQLRTELENGPGWSTPAVTPAFTPVHSDDDDDGYVSTREGMLANTRNFYTALYRMRRIHQGCLQRVLRYFPRRNRFSPEAIESMAQLVTIEEVIAAIIALKNGKASGPDGMTAEILKRDPELFAPLLADLYNASFRTGHGSANMMDGLIILLLKGGDPRMLSNVRPITLTSMVTSVLAGVFKQRMRLFLPGVTLPDQCASVPGRYMYESIHRILSALHWAKTQNAEMLMILQDMRKAFDLLDRGYLREVLLLLAQPDGEASCERDAAGDLTPTGNFIRWFDILLGTTDAPLTRRVLLNGEVDPDPLYLHSGVPQGLAVSAQLYTWAAEGIMGLLLHAQVTGIQMNVMCRSDRVDPSCGPRTEQWIVDFFASRYADDLIGFILLRCADDFLDCGDVYCCGTGQAGNVDKTKAFGVGRYADHHVPWDPAGRLKLLPPDEARGTVLGIEAGPAADVDEQWTAVATAMLTHMRRWQQHELSYGGRRHIQETYVWSHAWFLGAFHPPSQQLIRTLEAATRQSIWKGAITAGTTPASSAKLFPHSSRHKPERLMNPVSYGGQGWTPAKTRLEAIHVMWTVFLLAPHRMNSAVSHLATWYDMAADGIAQVLNVEVAADGDTATQTREALLLGEVPGFPAKPPPTYAIPDHWIAYLAAWRQLRPHLTVDPPNTHEQVLAVPLLVNSQLLTVSPSPEQRTEMAGAKVTHVRHLWHAELTRWRTPAELRMCQNTVDQLQQRMPAAWQRLLQSGTTPFAPGHWVLVGASCTDCSRPYCSGQLALVTSVLAPGMYVATMYSIILAGGWRPTGFRAVPASSMTHATVENECRATDGGSRVRWLTGPTALAHFASRDSVRIQQTGRATPLSSATQAVIRRVLHGAVSMSPSALQLQSDLGHAGHKALRDAFVAVKQAPWPPLVRNFAYDLAADALPCGQGIRGVLTSACIFCCACRCGAIPRDTVHHLVRDCPYLQPLRDLFAELWLALQWTGTAPSFVQFLVYGAAPRAGNSRSTVAIRGAMLAAARWARVVITASPYQPARPVAIRRLAQRLLRHHIRLDWQVSSTPTYRHMRVPNSRRLASRPLSAALFTAQWGCLCRIRDGSPTWDPSVHDTAHYGTTDAAQATAATEATATATVAAPRAHDPTSARGQSPA